MSNLKQSIEDLLTTAHKRNIYIRGSSEGLWFIVEKVRLDPSFTVPESDVMIKFENASHDPMVLIPQDVSLRPDAGIPDDFIEASNYIEGWKSIFPGLFLDVNGEMLELVMCVAGILGNLSLFSLVSPEAIEITGNEIIAEFIDNTVSDKETE